MNLSDLQGHWRRDWLRWPGGEGLDDETTRVDWLQAGALCADMRIPAERPAPGGARCLADLDPPALLQLMAAEGFAGEIALSGDVCTWQREINWHGRPEGIDAGRLRVEDGVMIEDGVHAPYRELWHRVETGPLRASRVAGGGLSGVLVASETVFLLALGLPGAKPSAGLTDALRQGHRPPEIAAHFERLYALGRWDGPAGVAELATNPFVEGGPVIERTAGGLTWLRSGFDGARQAIRLDQDQSAR